MSIGYILSCLCSEVRITVGGEEGQYEFTHGINPRRDHFIYDLLGLVHQSWVLISAQLVSAEKPTDKSYSGFEDAANM